MSAESSLTRNKRGRVAWIAGMRGQFMLMGQAFKALRQEQNQPGRPTHWMLATGEQGMAAYQAMDALGLIPDESAPLCHPADDLAVRLNLMLERAEAFGRHHKVTHVIFSGYGSTAAGAAVYCHSRGCHGLWLRPPDVAGLIPRLRWEAGLERIINACAPCVKTLDVPHMPEIAPAETEACDPVAEVDGLRPDAPLAIVAVMRRDWGMLDDSTRRLSVALGALAAQRPDMDWLVISNLNARIEGPLRSLENRPANLLLSPPLPPAIYHGLLARAAVLMTDSPMIASEGLTGGRLIVALADDPAGMEEVNGGRLMPVTIGDLDNLPGGRTFNGALEMALERPRPLALARDPRTGDEILGAVRQWLAETGA